MDDLIRSLYLCLQPEKCFFEVPGSRKLPPTTWYAVAGTECKLYWPRKTSEFGKSNSYEQFIDCESRHKGFILATYPRHLYPS